VCFNQEDPATVATARHFAKAIDIFDGERRVRSMVTLLNPYSIAFVRGGTDAGSSGGNVLACTVGRCSFTVSRPVLKAPMVSALEARIS
jgi:hypothetical protein